MNNPQEYSGPITEYVTEEQWNKYIKENTS